MEVALYATPEPTEPVGSIRADRHPESDAECYRTVATVRWRADGRVAALPTEEYEEEEPVAAIVVEQRDRWFKVQIADHASAWLHASDRDEYFPLQELLVKRSAYLTEAWNGTLARSPGGAGRRVPSRGRRFRPVQFVESRELRGALWLKIQVMSHTIYESDKPARVVATGWVPAHDATGKVVVWFYSRD